MIEQFRQRFAIMKGQGKHINYVLDIGAYRGEFTETVRTVWPTAIVWQIEADERQAKWLTHKPLIALLGDREQDAVNFYTLGEDKNTTGSSIFLEQTFHYNPMSTLVMKKHMTTVDALHRKHNFFGSWSTQGLIKIDAQGAELLILKGAAGFILEKLPLYILLECSITQYNKDAPLFAEVIEYMAKIGYRAIDIFGTSYGDKGVLLQTDIMFERHMIISLTCLEPTPVSELAITSDERLMK